jgi:neutral ceramidase
VAAIVGAPLEDVLVAGYSNGYIHYVTTPEEYLEQQYEGGSTLFGRWELPALQQVAARLAAALRDGVILDPGQGTRDLSGRHAKAARRRRRADTAPEGRNFGDVVTDARASYRPGQRVAVVFVAGHPANDLHRGGTYLRVEAQEGGQWRTVQDDGDWHTRFEWARRRGGVSEATLSWDIPEGTPAGAYRIRYQGDQQDEAGLVLPFEGLSSAFEVNPAGR